MTKCFTLLTVMTCLFGLLILANGKDVAGDRPLIGPGDADNITTTVWQVGPTRTYKKPSEVASLVQDGDIIEIDAADYVGDVARWAQHNLTFRGVGGTPNLDANYKASGRKAIWVIAGNNVIVENIRFLNCKDQTNVDKNWAGIRQEGTNLTVRNCVFYNNSNGILCGKNLNSNIVITQTIFDSNGHGDGQSHNLYIGQINSLTFTHNYSHKAVDGHELKSRAVNNYILYNRISDEDGTAARLIDLPNGGISVIMGNVLQQGPNVNQRNMVGYGLEGVNPGLQELYVVNNTFVNDHANVALFIDVGRNTQFFKAYNNIFAGQHNPDPNKYFNYRGTATAKDISSNIFKRNVADAGLVDPANIDYHLAEGSEAIGAGTNAGVTSHGFDLTPVYEYVHTASRVAREGACNISLGAYEFGTHTPADVQVATDKSIVYHGYLPEATATLTVSATSDRAPFTYLWSTGETTDVITVSPTATTVYEITVTDAVGCQVTEEVTINVIDVRCGPANHQKVRVCNRAGQELCIDAHAVPVHLMNGGMLGACGADGISGRGTVSTMEGLTIATFPNPFSDRMTIEITSGTEEHVTFDVYDLTGTVVKRLYDGYVTPGEVKYLELNSVGLKEGMHLGKIITKRGVETFYLMLKK